MPLKSHHTVHSEFLADPACSTDAIMPQAILLDMDDTILAFDHGVDTDSCWRGAFPRGLACDARVLLDEIKHQAKWFWSDPERHRTGRLDLTQARLAIVHAALQKLGIHDRTLAASIAAAYGTLRDRAVKPFPQAVPTVAQLRRIGIRLALLTNGTAEAQWAKIHRFELAPYFDCVLVEGEFGVGKPDERIYLHALQQLGVTADKTWMVGDNLEWEVAAPQDLGIKGVWIDHKGLGVPPTAPAQPYLVIRQLSDLLPAIRALP